MTKAKKLLKHYFPSAIWFLVVVKSKCIKNVNQFITAGLLNLHPETYKTLENC
jgi:hypothetical protein